MKGFRFSWVEAGRFGAVTVVIALLVAIAVPAMAHAERVWTAATPTSNTTFSGTFRAVPGVSAGRISFVISKTGQITRLTLTGYTITNFDCGGGRTISSSGITNTFYFPDPLSIKGGRFSTSHYGLVDWSGVFDSATSAHGTLRISVDDEGDTDEGCQNRPQSAAWTAVSSNAPAVAKASIARTPNKSIVTYTRRSGVARFALSAVIKGKGAKPIAGRYVYLQTSTNGRTWTSTYKIKTSSAGRAAKVLTVRTKQVRYYRWYVPAQSRMNLKTYSAATKVVVR